MVKKEFPINLLTELHFEEVHLTDKQEERLYEVLNASMSYERRVFDRYYVYGVPIDSIAREEKRDSRQIAEWIATIAANVSAKKDYILTGIYQFVRKTVYFSLRRRKNRVARYEQPYTYFRQSFNIFTYTFLLQ